ncbi:hypothetical protein Tco_1283364 [Tanacetum coccineum]
MADQDEVHDNLLAAKDAKRCEESKLMALNDDLVEQEVEAGNRVGGIGRTRRCYKPFEHMKEIVARDAVTLGELETLLACALVRVSLKTGFIADMEEKAYVFIRAGVSFYMS